MGVPARAGVVAPGVDRIEHLRSARRGMEASSHSSVLRVIVRSACVRRAVRTCVRIRSLVLKTR
eukprot:9083010-Lingulodinium_polyedra.AAC.1